MSIVLSNAIYSFFYFYSLHAYPTGWYGFVISTLVPLMVAYPISRYILRLMQELNRANERLYVQNTFHSKLLGIISHDVRSPLGVLHNMIELFESDLSQAEFEELLRAVKPQLGNTLESLDRLTYWVKMRMEDGEIERQSIELGDISLPVLNHSAGYAEDREVSVEYNWDTEAKLRVDPQALTIALTNLINNAIKHSRQHGKVIVSSEVKDNHFYIHIDDDGPGIPERVLKDLFQKTIDKHHDDPGKGMGVGLFLSQEFINMNMGTLSAENRPGQGARFSLTLPRS